MNEKSNSFPVGIDFERILLILSKQIYETPLAFIRENVQNAVDAVRIQAARDNIDPGDESYKIDVVVENKKIIVRDNGIGMSAVELRNFFWRVGASGKKTQEALAAGCVGTFGIGGFANFHVCEKLEVISCDSSSEHGTLTRLSDEDIRKAGTDRTIPNVKEKSSNAADPRGTIVIGYLRNLPNTGDLHRYLHDFVRFVPTVIVFNGKKISQEQLSKIENQENFTEITEHTPSWQDGDMRISGRLFEDRGHTIVALIEGLSIGGEEVNLTGHLRFENGPFDVFKRGFKLCATNVGTVIGVSGRLDCDRFIPTAGRDSLDSQTTSLLGRIVTVMERVAVETVLESSKRIAQHTRIFRYIVRHGLIEKMNNVIVSLADGTEITLSKLRQKYEKNAVSIFYGMARKQALNSILHARGHIVVLLPSDHHKSSAERKYLEQYCNAKAFDGMIDCVEHYQNLNRFEKVFLAEIEYSISNLYGLAKYRLIPGKLSEDIPVLVKEYDNSQDIEVFVDVRHQEVAKLEVLGFTPFFYSLVTTFCRDYLGAFLKKWSPKFFGDGALNLGLFAKKRSELWILLSGDIGVVRKGAQREVVKSSDVKVVNVGNNNSASGLSPSGNNRRPRILHIIDELGTTGLAGYYIRLPKSAFLAYGDLLPECESLGVVWAGNKVLYVASDTISAAFHYEIRLDGVVAAETEGIIRTEGAIQIEQPLQTIYEGIYFPIPNLLEPFIVPRGDKEIRVELHCDWFDTRTSKHWSVKEN